eukprot:jgi/Mesen1/6776/ME000348S06046
MEASIDIQERQNSSRASSAFERYHETGKDRHSPSTREWQQWRYIWGGSKYSGMMCMVLSSLAYSFMGLFVKLLSVRGMPALQTVLARCVVIALFAGLQLRQMGHPLLGSTRVRHLVVARALVGFIALSTFFYSIQLLPLRDATVLNFTTPVFTALLAAAILGEKWGSSEMAEQGRDTWRAQQHRNEVVGVAMAVIGAATGALSYILVRAVGKQGEPPLVCVFAFAALSAPLAGVGLLLSQSAKVPSVGEAAGLLAVGFSAYAAQVFLTRGLQLEKAARASSVQYVKVLGTYTLGVVFLHEVPSLVGGLGALLIAVSAAFLAYGSGA